MKTNSQIFMWIVWNNDGWGYPIQAETRGKAKVAYLGDHRDCDFIELRCRKATQDDLIYLDLGGTDFWYGMAGWKPMPEWE